MNRFVLGPDLASTPLPISMPTAMPTPTPATMPTSTGVKQASTGEAGFRSRRGGYGRVLQQLWSPRLRPPFQVP